MSVIQVETPFPLFNDIDGQPLENGYIFVGVVNLNPITNPIAAFFNAALTIPAPQPIRTLGGYPVNSGTPTRFFVGSDYSIQVQNRNGSVIYTSLSGNAYPGSAGSLSANATGTGAQTIFTVAFPPSLIYINGVYQNRNTYTLGVGNVTFSQAPPFNSIIEFVV
jgi:hypothetical protein